MFGKALSTEGKKLVFSHLHNKRKGEEDRTQDLRSQEPGSPLALLQPSMAGSEHVSFEL